MRINRKLELIAKDGQVLHQLEPYIAGLLVGGGFMTMVLFIGSILQ
jgi:hypothetical protein|tara:strand:+ start:819 stop:956 length:138 start_codon:yes stop_codon:yes gene_type:complete